MSFIRLLRHRLSRSGLRIPVQRWYHRGLTPADVFLASYPRSGNTWLRSLLFEIVAGTTPSFSDIDDQRSPLGYVGMQARVPKVLPGGGRLLKTHERYRREYFQAVYLVRDPRDVVASEYRLYRRNGQFKGDLEAFVKKFLRGTVNGYGSWGSHVASWLDSDLEDDDRLLLLRYEDMRRDPRGELARVVDFTGLTADSTAIERAIENNTLKRMRKREDRGQEDGTFRGVNGRFRFVHQGAVGGWRDDPDLQRLACQIEDRFETSMKRCGYSQ